MYLKLRIKQWNFGEVSLLINDFTQVNTDIIIHIAKNIKRLNIVTNHINKCKRIEEYLYNEFGIILNVSNNKRRSLLKSEVIINFDFPEELINKYRIYDNAVIINTNDKIDIKSKRFSGTNINYFKIIFPDKYKIDGFQNEIVYESLIYTKKGYKDIFEKTIKDKVAINKLIGNNGIISNKEINKIN